MLLYKKHRLEWIIVLSVTILVILNRNYIDTSSDYYYISRSGITFIGATCLVTCRSFIGFYHACIFALTLVAYWALAFDVSQGKHVLIYNNYEAIIYGLVGCQLIGTIPTIWAAYRDNVAGSSALLANLSWSKTK